MNCRVRLKFFESINDRDYLVIFINACTSVVDNRLCYSDNAIKGRVQLEMFCLQTDQSKVMRFFNVIVRLTWLSNIPFLTALEKMKIMNRERTYTLTNERRFEQLIFST